MNQGKKLSKVSCAICFKHHALNTEELGFKRVFLCRGIPEGWDMPMHVFRKGKALGLQSELLSARYHCQDGHKRADVGFNNQNLQAMSISVHVHRAKQQLQG